MPAFEKLVEGCKRAKEEMQKERPHLDDEDKALLAELARQAKEEGVVVRALSEWEANIFQCPLCQKISPWSSGIEAKDYDGGTITVCESCADVGPDEPGLTKSERGLR